MTKTTNTANRTKLVSYLLAALLAVQPLLETELDWSKPAMVARFVVKLLFAAGIAVAGRYVAANTKAKSLRKKANNSEQQMHNA